MTKEDSIREDDGEAMLVAPLAVIMPPEDEAQGLTEVVHRLTQSGSCKSIKLLGN